MFDNLPAGFDPPSFDPLLSWRYSDTSETDPVQVFSDFRSGDLQRNLSLDAFRRGVSSSDASSASDSQALDMASLIRELNTMEKQSSEDAFERQKDLLSLNADINSSLAKEAFDRSLEADSTKVQRYVSDMREAGINPIIAFSSGMPSIGSPASSAASASVGSVAKASTIGESAIGKKETILQGYIGMIAQLLGVAISSAGNVVSSAITPPKITNVYRR